MNNVFRVRRSHLSALADVVSGVVPPPRRLHGGCADPGHCPQHPGATPDGEEMVGVRVAMSGQAFHRLLVARGLVPC